MPKNKGNNSKTKQKQKNQPIKVKEICIVTLQGATKLPPNLDEQSHKAVKRIKKILNNLKLRHIAVIDMHNVLDLYKQTEQTPFQKLENFIRVCVSWVGSLDNTLGKALVPDMQKRIKSGQIDFGIICCARGKKPKRKKNQPRPPPGIEIKNRIKNRSICVEPGSKAHITYTLSKWAKSKHTVFFDDGEDHVASVKSVDYSPTKCSTYLVPHGDSAKTFIAKSCQLILNPEVAEALELVLFNEEELDE
jgi:hypothetical protein